MSRVSSAAEAVFVMPFTPGNEYVHANPARLSPLIPDNLAKLAKLANILANLLNVIGRSLINLIEPVAK